MPMMQQRVYLGKLDKQGNLVQVTAMTVREYQDDLKRVLGQKISRETYRTFNQKHQMPVLAKQAA
jgi:hypothetical protein